MNWLGGEAWISLGIRYMWRPWFYWSGKPSKSRVPGFWGGYVGVLLGLDRVKYVSGYRGGVRKMNVLAK